MISIQEAESINRYKRYATKHFNSKEKLADFFYPNYDEKVDLESYLRGLSRYKKKLAKYVQLRNDHYRDYIENKKEEDDGHKFFRQSLIYILSDCETKYEYWSKVKYDSLLNNDKMNNEIAKIMSDDTSDESNEIKNEEMDNETDNEQINNLSELSFDETFDSRFLDILAKDQQLFQKSDDNKISISLSDLTDDLLLSHLPILYRQIDIEFIGNNQEKYDTCKKYIHLARPLYMCLLAKDPEMKLFILTIVGQLCETIKNLNNIMDKLDKILCILLDTNELIYLLIDIANYPFLAKKIKNIQKIFTRLNTIINERRTIIACYEINDNLSSTCQYLIRLASQLVSTISPTEEAINKYSILGLKMDDNIELLLKKNTEDEMIHFYLNKIRDKENYHALINLELFIYHITQRIGRVTITDKCAEEINSKIKYLYNIMLEFLVQSAILKAIYYLEAEQMDCNINNVILLSHLLSVIPSINQHLRQMNRRHV